MQRLKCLIGRHDWRRVMPVNAKNPPFWRCAGCKRRSGD